MFARLLARLLRDTCYTEAMFKPIFTITPKIVNDLSEIAQIKALVDKSPLLPVREAFLRRWATIKIAHTSTSIEGNTLEIHQVEQILENKPVRAQEKQITEVKNYLSALKLVDRIFKTKSKIDSTDVLNFHKEIVSGLVEQTKIGVFRPGPVYVVNVLPDGSEKLVYTPPASGQVSALINELLDWLSNSDNHPIINAGLLHYQFETIHPFTDGNGRVGRLLALLYLYKTGWNFRKVLVLEDYYNDNREAYYTALQTGVDYSSRLEVDLTSWLEYFIEGFLIAAKKVQDQVLTPPNTLSLDELKIIDFVLSIGKITSKDVVDILNTPKRTAQSKLSRLEKTMILIKKGAGPVTYYIIRSQHYQ